jgi:hypothetical protein
MPATNYNGGVMPKFYFNFRTGNTIERDPYGLDLYDLHAAREEALHAAREIVSDAIRFGLDGTPDHIIIADDSDASLATVALADVVPRQFRK